MTRWMTALLALGLVGWWALDARSGGVAIADSDAQTTTDDAVVEAYDGDPRAEASLVQAEDQRLDAVGAVRSGASSQAIDDRFPYRVNTEPLTTLVLPARPQPYTLAEVARLAPDTVTISEDGVATVGESLYVARGASLDITTESAHTVRLRSDEEAFASIVAVGGSITLAGTNEEPLAITSWDGDGPDSLTNDGRAYIRAGGGRGRVHDVAVESLGFWSGKTGGISFTGNDGADPAPSAVTTRPSNDRAAGPLSAAAAGPLPTVSDWPGLAAVVATGPDGAVVQVTDSTFVDNAFGLFLTGTGAASINNVMIERSRVDGLVLHRDASGTLVENVAANGSTRDGFRVGGGSDSLTFTDVTARNNGRNGLTLHSEPLAEGPSATGAGLSDFGRHSIVGSEFAGSRDNGVRIYGGSTLTVENNLVSGGRLGIVVSGDAQDVTITANQVSDASSQGIAAWDGVAGTIVNNSVNASETGIYARGADVEISGNDVAGASAHGISIVGAASGTTVSSNTVAGVGSSAIDTLRATGTTVTDTNDTSRWSEGSLVQRAVGMASTPLAMLWIGLAVILMAATGLRWRARRAGLRHPYPGRERLDELTTGVEKVGRGDDNAQNRGVPRDRDEQREPAPVTGGIPLPRRRGAHMAPRHRANERETP